ncbi:hypothetical protein AJ79_09021 [Helicocarpus griseus UAMH5409]|uniref:Transcriptional coactivator p15 (PC4) C-terminal domain-containing protein n=1 Tax=Helicocarpus griseus UAMH5409 TaxID=1447875 RepID=A0A2B7WMY1_9EURO|nr:hypothetical protein AJ79_09021 [Helicocarpus griseus UAMH5409]
MASTKRRQPQSDEEQAQIKRAKKDNNDSNASPEGSSAAEKKIDSNGDPYWNISRQRRLTISSFKGRTLVNVREYYEKDGQELPGKKGISMPLGQFNTLVQLLPDVEVAIKEKGGSLDRPSYANGEGKEAAKSEPEQEESGSEPEESEESEEED